MANMVGYTILWTDGTIHKGEMDADHKVMLTNLKALWATVSIDTHFERVRVFWPRHYTDMFVDELGQRKGLKINYKATRIYRNNVIYHERITDPDIINAMPAIHGPAILFDNQVWY